MKRKSLPLIFALISLCACSHRVYSQNDIALNKKYTVSAKPNYVLASPDAGGTLLTDGVYTSSKTFWTAKTTVGWQYYKRFSIDIDLEKSSPISKVAFNSVRGNAGVEFPSNVLVFTSNDKKTYAYSGDAASDPDNIHGTYEVKKFTLSGINKTARYIKLVIVPKGAFVFCDEIEVIAGDNTSNDNHQNQITNINSVTDSLIKIKFDIKKLAYKVQQLNASMNAAAGTDSPEMVINKSSAQDIRSRFNKVNAQRQKYLKGKLSGSMVVDKVSPWETIVSPYLPKGTGDKSYDVVTTANGVQYGAFVVTNLSSSSQVFNCRFSNSSDISINELFTVPFVTSGPAYTDVADPLVSADRAVTLEPGGSRMFMFRITGKHVGESKSNISITAGGNSSILAINVKIVNAVTANDSYSLNAHVWAYLSYPLLSDRQDEAINDLLAHHITTMAVPPFIVPVVGTAANNPTFVSYISKLKAFDHILLFMDMTSKAYKDSFKNDAFMSDAWKAKFNAWYNGIAQNAESAGISPSNLYLYLYDEIKDADIAACVELLKWLQTAHPEIHTFGTLTTKNSIDALSQLLTVPVILSEDNLLQEAKGYAGKSQWVYETKAGAELLSPYSYYRMLGWKAFVNGYSGVGFWDYADYENGSGGKTDLDNFDGVNATNYSVIYDGPGKSILSSRRWEAFKLGVEDYELLRHYAQKYSTAKAKQLAQSVLDNQGDITKADVVRAQILQSL